MDFFKRSFLAAFAHISVGVVKDDTFMGHKGRVADGFKIVPMPNHILTTVRTCHRFLTSVIS